MTKRIPLSQGKYALVDDDDYEFISQWKWSYNRGDYAKRLFRGKTLLMHRVLMNPKDDEEIDHINGNGLDNRRSNLRICNHFENTSNRGLNRNSTTGAIGVYRVRNKYRAALKINYKTVHVGYFDNIIDAIKARDKAAKKYRGEFARINTNG